MSIALYDSLDMLDAACAACHLGLSVVLGDDDCTSAVWSHEALARMEDFFQQTLEGYWNIE
jgi:hypothetical protein